MRFKIALLIVCLMARGLAAQTTAPGDPAEILRLAREKEKQGIVKQLADAPSLPPVSLADLLELGLRDGHLTLRTRVAPDGAQSRLEVKDLPGISAVTIRNLHNAAPKPGPYEPDFFLLESYRFDEPNSTVACLTVEALPISVQVSWASETLTGMTQVMLVEQVTATGAANARVPANILVRVSEETGDAADPAKTDAQSPAPLELRADSFTALYSAHPTEVDRYLRPIFQKLHAASAVLPSDTVMAWQIFAAEARPAPEVVNRARELVVKLDADDEKERESAQQSLLAMGPAAGAAMAAMDRAKWSPEQTSRVDTLLAHFHPLKTEAADTLAHNTDYLLDCLLNDDPFVVRTAESHLKKLTGHVVTVDETQHGAAREAAVNTWRARLSAAK